MIPQQKFHLSYRLDGLLHYGTATARDYERAKTIIRRRCPNRTVTDFRVVEKEETIAK